MKRKAFYMGIDGGATKTAVVITNAAGTILAEARGAKSNIHTRPSQEAREVLSSLTCEALIRARLNPDRITRCVLGLNGVDCSWDFEQQHRALAGCLDLPGSKLTLVNDGIVALWGASAAEQGAVLQAGTGFTSAYRSGYGQEQLFDHYDTGRMYDIRTALTAALSRMIDGRKERTPLLEKALAFFKVAREADFRELLYGRRIPRQVILNTPPLIYAAWEEGDPAAAEIMDRAVADYVLAARTMLKMTGSETADMVFGGGVILRGPERLWERLEAGVRERFPASRVMPPALEPVYGAAVMAGFKAGEDHKAMFVKMKEHKAKEDQQRNQINQMEKVR